MLDAAVASKLRELAETAPAGGLFQGARFGTTPQRDPRVFLVELPDRGTVLVTVSTIAAAR